MPFCRGSFGVAIVVQRKNQSITNSHVKDLVSYKISNIVFIDKFHCNIDNFHRNIDRQLN